MSRLRFGFAKTGSLALISHLDTVRLLERALRRSGLPVSFTGGFHPLPRLQLALSLPLGVEGLGEWFDLEFTAPLERLDLEVVRRQLQAQLPAELPLLSVAAVPVFGPSLSQELLKARWRFDLWPQPAGASAGASAGAVPPVPSAPAWDAALADLLAAETLIWSDTDKKGRPRQRDCRPYLLQLEPVSAAAEEGLAGVPAAQRIRLELEAAIDLQGRSLRPEQLQHWLAERLASPLQLGRVERRLLQLRPC